LILFIVLMESERKEGDRIDLWADRAVGFWDVAIKCYNVEYFGLENVPNSGAALVLPKHQYLLDIPLEGIALRNSGRYGNWVMKNSLPGWLDCLGTIRYVRPDDVKKRVKREKAKLDDSFKKAYMKDVGRGLFEEMKEFNTASNEYSKWLYSQGEIIVSHPEGTRVRGKMGKLWSEFIDLTRDFSNESGINIPVIPMGIEYAGWSGFSLRPKIYVRLGKQIDVNSDDLMGIVAFEMAKLSNIGG
jgi:1-acyl-sn-glycerol-3-phosphate acyltransferase